MLDTELEKEDGKEWKERDMDGGIDKQSERCGNVTEMWNIGRTLALGNWTA